MLKHTLRAAALLALVAAVAAPVAVAAPGSAPRAAAASQVRIDTATPPPSGARFTSTLKGEARLGYQAPGEHDVRVSIDARSSYGPGSQSFDARGTFRLSHEQNGEPYWGDFAVDCLRTGGPTATVTGRLVRTNRPDHPWLTQAAPGFRLGLSFLVPKGGKGGSRVGVSGSYPKDQPELTPCMAPAADMQVVSGGYRLTDRRPAERAEPSPGE
ncbi:hypothetical protein ACIP93_16915 [Streptomyces sp. NPDC088745]|uniref:hypothetical protein n=1 Tax=Streptomyces sp. NPDC088745 TaxID=3365884 RepID=UPI0038133BA9